MKRFMQVLLAGLFLAALGAPVNAAIIASHSGANDPAATEGWTFDPSGTGTQSGGTDSEAYWRIQRDADAQGRYLFTTSASALTDPSGWTMTARVKANTAAWMDDVNLAVLDSSSWWKIALCADPTGYMGVYTWNSDFGFGSQLSAINPSAAYHTYQIIYNPVGDAVSYYMDGGFLGGQTRSSVPSGYGIYRAGFGDDNGLAASDSQWFMVSLQTGQHVVPEPSTLALMVAGLLGLLAYACGKRQ